MEKTKVSANLSCFLAMLFWAVSFPGGEVLLETWGTLTLLIIRYVSSIIILLLIWGYIEGYLELKKSPWKKGIIIGSISWGLGGMLLLLGQKLSDPVTPTICIAMMPIFGALTEVVFDKRKFENHLLIALILALSGGYLATGVKINDGSLSIGTLCCLISVTLFAWGTRSTTKNLENCSSLSQTTTTLSGAAIFFILVYFACIIFNIGETQVGISDMKNIILLIIFCLFSLTIAQFLWIWGAGKIGVFIASLHSNAVPFYVMIMMVLIFQDPWNWLQALGAMIVALGVIISQNRQWYKFFLKIYN